MLTLQRQMESIRLGEEERYFGEELEESLGDEPDTTQPQQEEPADTGAE
jgi:hypothetical protein